MCVEISNLRLYFFTAAQLPKLPSQCYSNGLSNLDKQCEHQGVSDICSANCSSSVTQISWVVHNICYDTPYNMNMQMTKCGPLCVIVYLQKLYVTERIEQQDSKSKGQGFSSPNQKVKGSIPKIKRSRVQFPLSVMSSRLGKLLTQHCPCLTSSDVYLVAWKLYLYVAQVTLLFE